MEQMLSIFPEKFITVLGWTIFHSIWQAAVLGSLLTLMLRSIPQSRSRSRYIISVFTLGLIFIVSVLTYFVTAGSYAVHEGFASAVGPVGSTPAATADTEQFFGGTQSRISLPSSLFTGVSKYFNLIVSLWVFGVAAFSLRTAGGICLTIRYKRKNVSPLPSQVLGRFQEIKLAFGIKKRIRYLSSCFIRAPVLIGYFKPVVLIPSSLVSGIPVAQLDAVITHELAHIARNDYLLNMIQSILEIVYFYHPVVWLVSRQIRIEREHCCDDICIRQCGNAVTYVRALASVSGVTPQIPSPALALAGRKKLLYNRIHRIINPHKMKTKRYDKLTAGIFIFALALILTLSTGADEKPDRPAIEPAALINIPGIINTPGDPVPFPETAEYPLPDVIPLPQDTTIDVKNNRVKKNIRHDDGTQESIEMLIRNGEVEELYIDGERIPGDRMGDYQELIEGTTDELLHIQEALQEARTDMESVDFEQLQEEFRKQAEELRMITEKEMQQLSQELQDIRLDMPDIEIDLDKIRNEIDLAMQDLHIDVDKMRSEVERAMREAQEACEDIDWEEIREEMEGTREELEMIDMNELQHEIQEEMERAREHIESIDREALEQHIQEAIEQLKQINIQEIQHGIQQAMEDLWNSEEDIEQQKQRMNEMIEEIEKLELDTK